MAWISRQRDPLRVHGRIIYPAVERLFEPIAKQGQKLHNIRIKLVSKLGHPSRSGGYNLRDIDLFAIGPKRF